MAKDRRVVNKSAALALLRICGEHIRAAGDIVAEIVDRGVVHAVEGRAGGLQRVAAVGMASLGPAVTQVVPVELGGVGAIGGAEVGVLVVVAADVERLVAAAALGHAIPDEVAQGRIVVNHDYARASRFNKGLLKIAVVIKIELEIINRRIIDTSNSDDSLF